MNNLYLKANCFENETSTFKKIYSFLFSTTLVLAIFKVPILEIGFSTFVLILSLPYAIYMVLKNRNFKCVFPIIVFIVYTIFVTNEMTIETVVTKMVLFVHLVGAFNGTIDFKFFAKSVYTIACILTFLVALQTIAHYVLHINIVYLNPNFVLDANRDDVLKQYNVSGLYRPSAIFLEPSHYAQFSLIAISLSLFYKYSFKKAIIIGVGCFLTTSGLGIVMCFGVIGFYLLFDKRLKKKRLLIISLSVFTLIISFVVLYQFSFFKSAVMRIIGHVDGYNAIEGRLFWWKTIIGSLNKHELLFGVSNQIDERYMTGIMEIIYKHGIIGFIVLSIMVISIIFTKKKILVTFIGFAYLFLMVFANLANLISMVFWIGVICAYPEMSVSKKGIRI